MPNSTYTNLETCGTAGSREAQATADCPGDRWLRTGFNERNMVFTLI